MSADVFEIELQLLLEALYRRYQYDFRQYALGSLRRRLQQALSRFGCPTLSALQERVLREPQLFLQLLPFLTVQVSDLFRDPAFYRALREEVAPFLRTWPAIKLWVAGCSTGEEVYSLAILLREERLLERSTIVATDINPKALETAERGAYDAAKVAQQADGYRAAGGTRALADYYTVSNGAAVFDPSLRKRAIFSVHSLATDPPFQDVQLITCRNVLIYFTRELQDRALGLFRDALSTRGYLDLGSKETARFSSHADAFDVVSHEQKIYRKK